MISSFSGLQVALRGLLAEQQALNVTGHNIANVNTTGYTRQEAVMAAALPHTIPAGAIQNGAGAQIGQGVDVQSFRRARDMFSDLQYRAANMDAGLQASMADGLDQIQSSLQEPGDSGLASLMDSFYTSWQTLAANPTSTAAKAGVAGAAKNLSDALNALDSQFAAIQTNAGSQYTAITGPTGAVQADATQIARLNAQIKDAVGAGQQPNDLLDERDKLLDDLSHYGQVSVTDLGNGSISLQFGDAPTALVNDTTVTWPQALTTATGGQLGALLDLSSATGTLAGYRSALDTVAANLATSVNAVTPSPIFSGTTAATLATVATAATVTAGSGAAGTNDIATAVAALRGGTAQTGYADLVRQIGADAASAQRKSTNADALVASADARRQNSGGVSLDEEMSNMLRFQRGYQAASRAMSTVDEMLDVLINRTGKVGL